MPSERTKGTRIAAMGASMGHEGSPRREGLRVVKKECPPPPKLSISECRSTTPRIISQAQARAYS